jgi:diguanylate cyclase (GGDEF)-like protein
LNFLALGGLLSTEVAQPDVFSFKPEEESSAETPDNVTPLEALARVIDTDDLNRMRRSIEAVGEATYHWILETDEIRWSPNIKSVLECESDAAGSGRAYASLLDSDNITSRYDTVMRSHATDEGDGVPFQIEYLFRPEGRNGRRAIWLEDNGKWFAGKGGRPAEVFGTIRKIDDRHSRDQHLSFLGNCDPLTGMMNRGRLAEALGETITTATREQRNCAFLIAAVNNLSVVNEAYGFEVADEVIIAMGRRLRQVVRTGDAIARYSGSKFGVILNGCNDEELQIAVDRFVAVARESVIETERGPVWAMLSIGAVVVPKNANDANLAMARAEEALTEARRLPSDGSIIYRPSTQRTAERGLNARCATEIVKCLKEDKFILGFQPIVSARTQEIVMHETLLRMSDTEGVLIEAAHLIPVAEKLGLVRLIDRAVAQMTIATLHSHPKAHLSMNVSGATATDPRWFNQLTDIIIANKSVAERLTVEITETIALGNIKETFGFVEKLRNIGCSVAIDDFGAGFTSFRNLRELPVNIIKLDGSFCRNLSNNSANQYLVKTLVDLGHKFSLKVIAEWVETPEDLAVLQACGIDLLQGHLFGEATVTLPWEKSEDLVFSVAAEESGETAMNFEATETEHVILPEAPQHDPNDEMGGMEAVESLGYDADMKDDMEDGLSRLRQAIQVLDSQFRSPADEIAAPMAKAG